MVFDSGHTPIKLARLQVGLAGYTPVRATGSAMNETSLNILRRHFKEATQELLDHYKFEAHPVAERESIIELVSTLGFGAEGIAGAIALCTSSRCAKYMVKTIEGKHEHDWLGELSNQLLGRVKRRLGTHGVTFSMGIPVLFKGERIALARSLDLTRSIQLTFETPEGLIEAWLDFKTSPNIELSPEPIQNEAPSEGEILLF